MTRFDVIQQIQEVLPPELDNPWVVAENIYDQVVAPTMVGFIRQVFPEDVD